MLAWAPARGGGVVVATDQAVYLPDAGSEYSRFAYESVATATWQDPLLEVVQVGSRGARRVVELSDPGRLPPAVRERVTASVVISERVDLPGGGRVLVSARRPPAGEGIRWNVVFDAGVDPRDPGVRAAADQVIAELRASTGL